jgi:hypothetical protein
VKRMIVVLVILCAAVMAAGAQTNENTLASEAPTKVLLPAEEVGGDSLNTALGEAATLTNTVAAAPLFRATVNSSCQPQPKIFITGEGVYALGCNERGIISLPAPRWPDLQPQIRPTTGNGHSGFQWASALKQSLLFLGVQHGYAMTQAKTRRDLKGPFWRDYFRSVTGTGGWADGGRFFTNYISHPMEGAITGYIQVQNDPRGKDQEFSRTRGYWISRLKAMAWTAVYSTQFEIGPVSQSSIGNVGLHSSLDGKKRKMAYVDLVVTPTIGTAWLVGEDVLDRYLVRWVEGRSNRLLWRGTARVLFNPMRAAANLIRFKTPWYRDR